MVPSMAARVAATSARSTEAVTVKVPQPRQTRLSEEAALGD